MFVGVDANIVVVIVLFIVIVLGMNGPLLFKQPRRDLFLNLGGLKKITKTVHFSQYI